MKINDDLKAQIEDGLDPIEKIKNRVKSLINLDPISRDVERKKIIKETKISAKAFDSFFESLISKKTLEDSTPIVSEVDPWEGEVDGARLLHQMAEVFSRFAVLPDNMGVVLALWAMLTYCYDLFRILPQVAIYSPEKRCGKSTVLEILHALALRGLIASNISSAAVYRTIENCRPCLIIDEADTFFNENIELRGVCNSGHTKKTAFVVRVAGDDHEPTRFSTWCPKVIALIGELKDTQHDRSIVVPMRRKLPGERVEKLPYDLEADCLEIRQKCARWAYDNKDMMKGIVPQLPATGNDRQADNWHPLFVIAGCAGGEWPEIVKGALLGILEDDDENDSIAIKLLKDIRGVFEETCTDKLSSERIVEELRGLQEAPWLDWNYGRGLTQHGLGRQLRHFKIKPGQLWIHGGKLRGYTRDQFKDSFKRYLVDPEPPIQSGRTVEPSNDAGFPGFQSGREKNILPVEKPGKRPARLNPTVLPLEKGVGARDNTQKAVGSEFWEVP